MNRRTRRARHGGVVLCPRLGELFLGLGQLSDTAIVRVFCRSFGRRERLFERRALRGFFRDTLFELGHPWS